MGKRAMTLKELQQTELDILIAFDQACREHAIHYSLGYGTMIGAVRHQGFIPWDDDIDVILVREEYEKFKAQMEKDSFILAGRYKVLLPGDEEYPYPFIKIVDSHTVLYEKDMERYELGVWIDIFPIDYCAQDEKKAMRILKGQVRLIRNYGRGRCRRKNDSMYQILKNILWLPYFRVINKHLKRKMLAHEKNFAENGKMGYMGGLIWPMSLHEIYPAEYFDGYMEMSFEKHDFMVFKRYDDILTCRYGDYMKLPPENERVAHDPEAYIKEDI